MNRSINAKRTAVVAALLVGGLSACGGGGDGSPSALPAVVDSGNAATITREVVEVVLDTGSVAVALRGDGPSNPLFKALARPRANVQSAQPSATIPAETFDCLASGTVRLSGAIANFDTLTRGDRLTADFNNCDDAAGVVVSGRMRLDVTSFSGDPFNNEYALGARMTLTNFAVNAYGVMTVRNGIANIDLDLSDPFTDGTFTMAGDRLSINSGSRAWILRDFALSVGGVGFGFKLPVVLSGSCTLEGDGFVGEVDFVAISPLVLYGGAYPITGELLITGANGATIRVTVLDATTLQLALDFNGDSIVDETQPLAWSSVGSLGAGQNQL